MRLVGVRDDQASKICRAISIDALLTAGILVLSVLCAFAYDIKSGLGFLLPAFFVGSVPLVLVAALDVVSCRRLAVSLDPSLARKALNDAARSAAAGLPLLLFGILVTLIEVGVGGVKTNHFAVWTSTAVGFLLLVGLGAQTVLLVLTRLMRRRSWATVAPAT